MKAILFSIGSRGDIEPFLTIAQLLKERDWDVICVFPEQFRKTVENMGFEFKGFSKEFLDLLDSPEAKLMMGGHGSLIKKISILIKMARIGMRLSKDLVALQHRIQMEERPDRILYHPKCNYSVLWGMANEGKAIMVSPVPGVLHQIKHINVFGSNYGKFLNVASFWAANAMKALMLKKISKQYRADYKGLKITISSIKKAMLKREKTLYTISPSLFPKPVYWPSSADVVGYHERDKTVNWLPDENLLQFLEKNEKIIFITFGSMSNPDPAKKTRIILKILKRNNISAIINTSWGGLEKLDEQPNHIYFSNNLPYDWLFSKMYAVVHHGGSGTIHTALKYACPNFIIPHALDQFFWGKTISELQLGPKALPIKKFNEADFEAGLLDLITSENYKKNARVISKKMEIESDRTKLYEMIVT